jgi:hypothetical protein
VAARLVSRGAVRTHYEARERFARQVAQLTRRPASPSTVLLTSPAPRSACRGPLAGLPILDPAPRRRLSNEIML